MSAMHPAVIIVFNNMGTAVTQACCEQPQGDQLQFNQSTSFQPFPVANKSY